MTNIISAPPHRAGKPDRRTVLHEQLDDIRATLSRAAGAALGLAGPRAGLSLIIESILVPVRDELARIGEVISDLEDLNSARGKNSRARARV